MSRATNIYPVGSTLYFLPIQLRVPLKFGAETLTSVVCARVAVRVENGAGRSAIGWGETPLSVQWVWPSTLSSAERLQAMKDFSMLLAREWSQFRYSGHPIEIGHAFQTEHLPGLWKDFNRDRIEPMPWLAALVCCSLFDIAVHDAFGVLNEIPVYETYNADYMSQDLGQFLTPAEGAKVSFAGRFPQDYLVRPRAEKLSAWHLVGGKDLLDASELDGSEPNDGYPLLLPDWIRRDGLRCLKIKLRGNDMAWDYDRILRVGEIALENDVVWLTVDFNCTVTDPSYVNTILDRLMAEKPRLYGMILYVEQPFPYDLESNQIDVHSVSARKPLFMDESAHDWHLIKLGRTLGWTGVALKTCKTQTGALLSLCWAKSHGLTLMVQDLTNPMLAQMPHVLLAAHAGTIMGVETNGMQFYPEASVPEASIHPGIFRRREGSIQLDTLTGPGFGYQANRIPRTLPPPAVAF